ncbi:MAG: iron ABC transporter permease [Proteobacteria bacterium]|nr:iron ABC transporter permease [Pseudomonadota bacterium]
MLPFVGILTSIFSNSSDYWQHFQHVELTYLLKNTFILTIAVLVVTLIMGVTVALASTMLDFPGRHLTVFLAIIPFTIPSYVMGFVWLYLFAHLPYSFGHLPMIAELFSRFSGFPGLVWSLSLSLFPYVFVMTRLRLQKIDRDIFEAAQSLGHGLVTTTRTIVLPLLIPTILAASFLVTSEVLSDFGTVSLFSYNTLTTAIFKAWFGFFAPHDALKVATILLGFALTVLILSRFFQSNQRIWQNGLNQLPPHHSQWQPQKLPAPWNYLTSVLVLGFLSLSSLLPVVALIYMSQANASFDSLGNILPIGIQSLIISGSVALTVTVLCTVILFARRWLQDYQKQTSVSQGKWLGFLQKITYLPNLGYALPGAAVAICLFVPLSFLNQSTFLAITPFFILLCTLTFHFYGVGDQTLGPHFESLPRELDESAQSLKLSGSEIFFKVHLPLTSQPIIFCGLFLLIDVLKELPITLMLRPLGWNTLSVKVYQWASEGLWEMAALPSLMLVVCSASIVIVLYLQGHFQFSGNRLSHNYHLC